MTTVQVPTSKLVGAALDWAVAKAVNQNIDIFPSPFNSSYWPVYSGTTRFYQPSESWSQGGPLIEKHVFRLEQTGTHTWLACSYHSVGGQWLHQLGETALVAAMRVAVTAELGDTVEIPEELVK